MENQLGITFKKVRIARGFKVSEAAKDVCTTQFLNKFESGKSDIATSKLIGLLNNIFVSMEEFMIAYQGENVYEYNAAVSMMNDLELVGDVSGLLELADSYLNKEPKGSKIYQLIAISIRARAYTSIKDKELDPNEIQIAKNYLDKIESWGIFELFIFCEVARFFTDDYLLHNYKKIMAKDVQFTKGTTIETNIILDTALNLATYFISRAIRSDGEDKEAVRISEYLINDGLDFLQGGVGNAYPMQKLNYRIKKCFLQLLQNDANGLYQAVEIMKIFIALGDRKSDINAIYEALKFINKTGIDIDTLL